MRSTSFRLSQVANFSFQGLFSQGHHCPCQEHRRQQAYDGEQTRVAWTLAGRLCICVIRVHDPHSLKSLSLILNNSTIFHSCIDPRQCHLKLQAARLARLPRGDRNMRLVTALTTIGARRAFLDLGLLSYRPLRVVRQRRERIRHRRLRRRRSVRRPGGEEIVCFRLPASCEHDFGRTDSARATGFRDDRTSRAGTSSQTGSVGAIFRQ
jgi:hypothetical protein